MKYYEIKYSTVDSDEWVHIISTAASKRDFNHLLSLDFADATLFYMEEDFVRRGIDDL